MKVSVIIPTYNGAHKILQALRSIEKQSYKPDEVLVVVDGSTDGTAELLRTTELDIPNLKIIEQSNSGRAQVRNRGAKEAACDLLVFFDDDMVLAPVCIERHIAHHQEYKLSILTGGLQEPINANGAEFSLFKSYLNTKWNQGFNEVGLTQITNEHPYLTAGNLSIPKVLFFELHGFDASLTDAEDYDLAIRAVKHGVPLFYSADAFAWHNETVNCLVYVKRLRQYAAAQEKLLKLKPHLYEGSIRKVKVPNGIKSRAFRFFCSKWWIASVDQGVWMWLPKSIRFRIYDWIVTANGSFFPDKVSL